MLLLLNWRLSSISLLFRRLLLIWRCVLRCIFHFRRINRVKRHTRFKKIVECVILLQDPIHIRLIKWLRVHDWRPSTVLFSWFKLYSRWRTLTEHLMSGSMRIVMTLFALSWSTDSSVRRGRGFLVMRRCVVTELIVNELILCQPHVIHRWGLWHFRFRNLHWL